MKKLLIATTNKGKVKEILQYLEHLPFEIVSLSDIDAIPEPEETEDTLEGNAILKAKYYAEKTGFISLADDGGLFIDACDGWPGVKSARVADTDEDRRRAVLEKMKDMQNRDAEFRVTLACYDPETKNSYLTTGIRKGEILTEEKTGEHMWGYNPIFYLPDINKTYAELSAQEKNATSHRGKALNQMKFLLQNQYAGKHIVVPFSLIIKDTRVLMILRNDPHRLDYHKKWEFPGGSMELGESLQQNVIRETKEETGYDVTIIQQLSHIGVEGSHVTPTNTYQVYLIPFVCTIVSGEQTLNDMETLDIKWFEIDDVLKQNLIGENARMYEKILDELKEVIQKNNL